MRPLWETVRRFLRKPKVEAPCDPEVTRLDIYLKSARTAIGNDICTPAFPAALLTIAKGRKQCESPSTDEWKEVRRHTCTRNGDAAQPVRKRDAAIRSNMDGHCA